MPPCGQQRLILPASHQYQSKSGASHSLEVAGQILGGPPTAEGILLALIHRQGACCSQHLRRGAANQTGSDTVGPQLFVFESWEGARIHLFILYVNKKKSNMF